MKNRAVLALLMSLIICGCSTSSKKDSEKMYSLDEYNEVFDRSTSLSTSDRTS